MRKEIDKTEEDQDAATVFEPQLQSFGDNLLAIGNWLSSLQTTIFPFIEQLAKIDWQAVVARLERMPRLSREAMQTASAQGWFFNLLNSMEETFELIEGLENATSQEIDEILQKHFTKDIEWYGEELTKLYPARKLAIDAAISAHKSKEFDGYFVSIPVFLAQADGLLSEIANLPSAMDKRDGVVKGSTWVKGKIGDDQQATDLLHPILKLHELDILKSKSIRDAESLANGKTFDALNRHQIMHGESSDYGNEINSLKAFSFLVFVGLHIPHVIEDVENRIERDREKQT